MTAPTFSHGYTAALRVLGLEKFASWRQGANRMVGGAALGGLTGALTGLSQPAGENYSMREVGRLSGIGALGGLGLGAATHAFNSPDPAPMPVRAGIGGLLGGGIGAGIPYLLGSRDPNTLKRLAMMGAGGGAGIGLFSSIVNPHKKKEEIPADEAGLEEDLPISGPDDLPEEWWKR